MSDTQEWIEEARKRADSKHNARQARFMAPDDDDPNDPDIVLLQIGDKVEGVVADLSEVETQFGPTILATIDGTDWGTIKVLAGPKILSDLFAQVQIGDFVSLIWNGKRSNKAGDLKYRHWSVAHVPAPGSTPKPAAPNLTTSAVPSGSTQERLPMDIEEDDEDEPF